MRSIGLCKAYRFRFLLFFAFFLNHPRLALADSAALSFDEAQRLCLAQSLESKRATLRRDEAAIDHRLVRSELYPQLSFGLTAGEQRREWQDEGGDAIESSRDLAAFTRFNYRLYDFGRSQARLDQTELQIEIEAMTIDEINAALSWRLARAYQNYLSAAYLVAISKRNREASSAKLESIRRGFKQGLRPENDLLSAEADYATTKLSFERSEADLRLQKRAVELLIGQTLPESSRAGSDQPSKPWRSPTTWRKLLENWGAAERSPTEIRRELEKRNLANLQRGIDAARRPSLDLQLGAEQELYDSDRERLYTGQLQLTWTLPWTGEFRAETERIAIEGKILDLEDAIERRDRDHARILAMDRFQMTAELAESAETLLDLRERQYQLGKARYEVGRATALELSNFEVDLGNARLEEARIANQLAAAVLDVAEALQIKDVGSLFRSE